MQEPNPPAATQGWGEAESRGRGHRPLHALELLSIDSIVSFFFSFSLWHLSFLLGEGNSVLRHLQELPCLQFESLAKSACHLHVPFLSNPCKREFGEFTLSASSGPWPLRGVGKEAFISHIIDFISPSLPHWRIPGFQAGLCSWKWGGEGGTKGQKGFTWSQGVHSQPDTAPSPGHTPWDCLCPPNTSRGPELPHTSPTHCVGQC